MQTHIRDEIGSGFFWNRTGPISETDSNQQQKVNNVKESTPQDNDFWIRVERSSDQYFIINTRYITTK